MAKKSGLRGYEILEPVGAGAESIIYRARELSSGRIVAVKDVTINSRESRKYLRHVKNEYAVLKRIHARALARGKAVRRRQTTRSESRAPQGE